MNNGARHYASPGALRRALTDRLRALAEQGRWTLPQLQRQIAYDRLIERLYVVDDGWIVKGAVALLARDIGMRATIDVDVYRADTQAAAEAQLRAAAQRDIGDWFRFEMRAGQPVDVGIRIPTVAYIGATAWAQFHVDLVGAGLQMTGKPERVPPLARVLMPDVEQNGYRVYPLVDHVADKVVATFQQYGEHKRPSTRYKDLVDLVSITIGASVTADAQLTALASESKRRGVRLPPRFDVPNRALWKPGYEAEAARSVLPVARTLDEALAIVRPFLDPLLDHRVTGQWSPQHLQWVP